jgi:hypothetical protein
MDLRRPRQTQVHNSRADVVARYNVVSCRSQRRARRRVALTRSASAFWREILMRMRMGAAMAAIVAAAAAASEGSVRLEGPVEARGREKALTNI